MKKLFLLCALLALGLAAYVQAQPGGGGRTRPGGERMGGGGAFSLESDWALICFELEMNKDQFAALKSVYKDAWNQRKKIMEEMQTGGMDRMMLMEELALIQEELEKNSQGILAKENQEKLARLKAARSSLWQGGGRRGR